jgi:hypothetical protein
MFDLAAYPAQGIYQSLRAKKKNSTRAHITLAKRALFDLELTDEAQFKFETVVNRFSGLQRG